MLMTVAGLIGAMGLVCVVMRRTLLGLLIGLQLMIMGATMMFVVAGIFAGATQAGSAGAIQDGVVRASGHAGGVFIAVGGIAQLVAGFALAIRLFYLKNKIEMSDLKSLKN
ncbi:MAG: NADH-quinone oxidoreductase subunit K [Bdellovibrionia bacterium]